jgi:hypothetical protein
MRTKMIASIGLLVACAGSALAQAPIRNEFYPLEIGNRWTYSVKEDAKKKDADPKKKVVIEVERAEVYVRKNIKDGTTIEDKFTGFILKSTSGDKVSRDHVVVTDTGIQRIHLAGTPINPPLTFFKFPVKADETWICESVSGSTTIKGSFIAKQAVAESPKGRLDYWIITFTNNQSGNERIQIDYWFARGYGMIKQHVKSRNNEIILELDKFEPAR